MPLGYAIRQHDASASYLAAARAAGEQGEAAAEGGDAVEASLLVRVVIAGRGRKEALPLQRYTTALTQANWGLDFRPPLPPIPPGTETACLLCSCGG